MSAENIVSEVVTAVDLEARVRELGSEISADYQNRRPVLVAVLIGSLPFVADLVRNIEVEAETDFLALSRFGEGGRIRIALDTSLPLAGRDVIIVEDIVDTGLTLTVLRRMLADRGAASVATVALLDKVPRRLVEVPLEYRGFEVGDEFLIGYGLDFDGRYRNLPALWAVLDREELTSRHEEVARYLYPGK
ncbi:MAG: hypoxanthine phosphoribosyltransferase [Acidimicrobiia bacterium]